MLSSIHIENVAIIKTMDIDFAKGLTVLTGQTGAGKSVILKAIAFLTGAKSDRGIIKGGAFVATVEGLFENISPHTRAIARNLGVEIDEEDKLIIRRTMSIDGKTQVRINGKNVTLSVLRTIAGTLISIHGQFDVYDLVNPEKHIELIDVYADNGQILDEYRTVYHALVDVRRQIRDLEARTADSERMKEILQFQIRDIDELKLRDGEEEELVEKRLRIRNSEKIIKNAEFAFKALKGSEKGSVAYLIDRSIAAISTIAGVLPEYVELVERLEDILTQTDDIAESVYTLLDGLDSDPTEMLNRIESRLDKISKIKRKYGSTVAEVLEYRRKAKEDLDSLENPEESMDFLARREDKLYHQALDLATKLHERRVKLSSTLQMEVQRTLDQLDMFGVSFYTHIREQREGDLMNLNENGLDSLEFFISSNLGQTLQPLGSAASGGELSRVMLALKGVILDDDGVSTAIFDEIDSGISGGTARKIGLNLLKLSRKMQVICITHSAQIASLAERHFLVEKTKNGNNMESHIKLLDKDGQVDELSRIMGGIKVTLAQRKAALDLLIEKEYGVIDI